MAQAPRPIGYWLKRLDRGIEDGFERALATGSLTRRHWQILNTLSLGPATEAQLTEALAPFWTEGAITQDAVLSDLAARGWTTVVQGVVELTTTGAEAHAAVASTVNATRTKILDGLTLQDYATVLDLLERMTHNVENDDPPIVAPLTEMSQDTSRSS